MRFFPMPASAVAGTWFCPMGTQGIASRSLPGLGRTILVLIAMLSALGAFLQPAQAESRMWVAVDNAKRRSCPSMECGVIGRLFFRETVVVYETDKGWSRVSGYTNAGCYEGKSAFVQSGRNDCSEENGISHGEFAVWVKSDSLTDQKPARAPEV